MPLPCSWIRTSGACSYGFWQSLPQINSFFSPLFCIQHTPFLSSCSLPSLCLSCPSSLGALCLPLPYWFCEVQWVERGTSNGRAWDQFPQKKRQHSLACHSQIICLQACPTEYADVFCFVIGAHQCQVSLLARCSGQTQPERCTVSFICMCKIYAHVLLPWRIHQYYEDRLGNMSD